MNIERVNLILGQILYLERSVGIQSKLSRINSFYSQNKPEELNKEKDEIYEGLATSIVNNYVDSDIKILKSLEIYGYFDSSLENQLEEILGSQGHEVQGKLTNFLQNRQEILEKIKQLKDSLNSLGFDENFFDINSYYIVFSFPGEYHDLATFRKALSDFDLFLSYIKKNDDYKISSVDNGCIEIFIETGGALGSKAAGAIRCALEIHSLVKIFEAGKDRYKNYTKENQTTVTKIEAEELERQKEELLNEFVDSLGLETKDKSDARNRFLKFFKHFEKGVSTEIRTPQLEEPREILDEDSPEQKKELKKQKTEFEQKKNIDEQNKKLFKLQKSDSPLYLGMEDEPKE